MFLENKIWVESIKTLLGSSYESNTVQTKHRDIKRESDIEDLINCANLVFGYEVIEKNYNIFKNLMTKLLIKKVKK